MDKDSERSGEEKKQLLALKKELKCWESMFERKHGRKPTKSDIDASPEEVRETYRQYQSLKGSSARKGPCVEEGTEKSRSKEQEASSQPKEDESGVFGAFLNKKKAPPETKTEGSSLEARAATWKLRKWTKGKGYSTVMVEGEQEMRQKRKGEGKGEEEGGESSLQGEFDTVEDPAGVTEVSIETSLEADLQGLSKGLKIRDSEGTEKTEDSDVVPIPKKQLKHGRNVSTKWLERCRPDLTADLELPQSHDHKTEEEGYEEAASCTNVKEGEWGGSDEGDSSLSSCDPNQCSPVHEFLDDEASTSAGAYERMFGSGVAVEVDQQTSVGVTESGTGECSQNSSSSRAVTVRSVVEKDLPGLPKVVSNASANQLSIETSTESSIDCDIDNPLAPQQSALSGLKSGEDSPPAAPEPPVLPIFSKAASYSTQGSHSQISQSSQVPSDESHSTQSCEGSVFLQFENFQKAVGKGIGTPELSQTSPAGVRVAHEPKVMFSKEREKVSECQNRWQLKARRCVQERFSEFQPSPAAVGVKRNSKVSLVPRQRQSKGKQKAKEPSISMSVEEATEKNEGRMEENGQRRSTGKEKGKEHSPLEQVTERAEERMEKNGRGEEPHSSSGDEQSRQGLPLEKGEGEPHKPTRTTGTVSENFVRLNMKIKRYTKKPGRITGSAYKRKMWKKYQKGGTSSFGGNSSFRSQGTSGSNLCFKCGQPGHWAKNCTEKIGSKNLGKFSGEKVQFGSLPEEQIDAASLEKLAKESPFPSVEAAALMARGIKPSSIGGVKGVSSNLSEAESLLNQGKDGDLLDGDSCGDSGGEEGGGRGKVTSSFVPPPPIHLSPSPPQSGVEPLLQTVDGELIDTPASVHAALRKFGYESFRPGQEEAIMRILSGVSTLLVQSTGSGKSLCYQLPAYLYSQRSLCITLVISPLVALMEDQVRHFPQGLRGACLHTNQTRTQRDKVLQDVGEGKVNVLLLSPEALVGGSFWSRRGGMFSLSRLPPVAFACIDEAHCVSEWSHNFRPSYLQLHKALRERVGVHCILGLTATATRATALSVAGHLGITEGNIISGTALPDNLHITVSCDEDRDKALVQLLQSPKMRDCDSIIIYCTRQQTTERVAQLLRTTLQSLALPTEDTNSDASGLEDSATASNGDTGLVGRKGKSRKRKTSRKAAGKGAKRRRKVNWSADCYHAGLMAAQRKRVQTEFMTGRLRIVVATVAFGMGLNKSDVRAIIHYNVPKSFESYVQEIGRAGRDGLPAYCHVFIDKEGSDLAELRRHSYSSSLDPYAVKQLVGKVFPRCRCKEVKQRRDGISTVQSESSMEDSHPGTATESPSTASSSNSVNTGNGAPLPLRHHSRWCAGHEVAIPIESTVQSLDAKSESLATLLCYLELQGWIEVFSPVWDVCTLKCYGGSRQLRALAQKVPAVAAAAARLKEQGTDVESTGTLSFSTVGVANSMGWESKIVRSELRGLQSNDRQTSGRPGISSTVLVEFNNNSFHLASPGDLTSEELDYVCGFLRDWIKKQEERETKKLHLLHTVLRSFACRSYNRSEREETSPYIQNRFKSLIDQYFTEGLDGEALSLLGVPVSKVATEISPELTIQISRDAYSLMSIHSDQSFSGRAIARIFQGIPSPCFPAEVWGRQHRFWRRYLDVDFNLLCKICTRKLLDLR